MTEKELMEWAKSLNEFPKSHLEQLYRMSTHFYFDRDGKLVWGSSNSFRLNTILKEYYDQLPEIEQLLLIKCSGKND